MDVMLQRHCAKYIYVVPDGLRELMTDISREVLRSQPENIYTFIADYLDALMITRENARIAAKLVQNLSETTETIMEFLDQAGMVRPEADRVTTFIQEAIHEYYESLPKKSLEGTVETEEEAIERIIRDSGITEEQAEAAAKIIQQAFRNYKMRKEKERELLSGYVDWRVAAKAAIKLYRKTGVSNEEAARAATLIKAAYKGYYTRRLIKRLAEENAKGDTEEYEMMGEEDSYGDYDADDDEDNALERKSKEKGVRINFDTVIPHVDFDEPVIIDEESKEAAAASAKEILDDLIDRVIPMPIEKTEIATIPTAEAKLATIPEESGDARSTTSEDYIKDLVVKDLLEAVAARTSIISQSELTHEPSVTEAPLPEETEASGVEASATKVGTTSEGQDGDLSGVETEDPKID